MEQLWGVMAAVLSAGLGGTSVGATRYLVDAIDPFAMGALRMGVGFVLLLPLALAQRSRLPGRGDWPLVAGLGILFFAIFPILFNTALIFTTAARGALALSTAPLLTMVIGAACRAERFTLRKMAGVLTATAGVALALISGLSSAPVGAWRGDLLMVAAALCMAAYSIASKPVMRRSAAIPFTTVAMGAGAAVLVVISLLLGSFAAVGEFGAGDWIAMAYLGSIGSALIFYLWSFAIERATPTQVTIAVTVNPVGAAAVGVIVLGEPIGWNIAAGIAAVFVGIWITASDAPARAGGVGAGESIRAIRWGRRG